MAVFFVHWTLKNKSYRNQVIIFVNLEKTILEWYFYNPDKGRKKNGLHNSSNVICIYIFNELL
jgi:hypothetical protein